MIDSEQHMRRIILGLFNPMPDGHKQGCLVNDPHIKPRGPCICGYAEIAGEYLWALREAKMIAAAHFGKKEVESAPRLKEPRQEGRKRTMSTKEQGLADTIMAMQEPERLRAEIERLRALLSACKVAMELSNENGGRTDWRHMIAGINSILQ